MEKKFNTEQLGFLCTHIYDDCLDVDPYYDKERLPWLQKRLRLLHEFASDFFETTPGDFKAFCLEKRKEAQEVMDPVWEESDLFLSDEDYFSQDDEEDDDEEEIEETVETLLRIVTELEWKILKTLHLEFPETKHNQEQYAWLMRFVYPKVLLYRDEPFKIRVLRKLRQVLKYGQKLKKKREIDKAIALLRKSDEPLDIKKILEDIHEIECKILTRRHSVV